MRPEDYRRPAHLAPTTLRRLYRAHALKKHHMRGVSLPVCLPVSIRSRMIVSLPYRPLLAWKHSSDLARGRNRRRATKAALVPSRKLCCADPCLLSPSPPPRNSLRRPREDRPTALTLGKLRRGYFWVSLSSGDVRRSVARHIVRRSIAVWAQRMFVDSAAARDIAISPRHLLQRPGRSIDRWRSWRKSVEQ